MNWISCKKFILSYLMLQIYIPDLLITPLKNSLRKSEDVLKLSKISLRYLPVQRKWKAFFNVTNSD